MLGCVFKDMCKMMFIKDVYNDISQFSIISTFIEQK